MLECFHLLQGPKVQRSAAPPPAVSLPAASMDEGPGAGGAADKLQSMLLAARSAKAGGRARQDELSLMANQSASAQGVRIRNLQELFDWYLPRGGGH